MCLIREHLVSMYMYIYIYMYKHPHRSNKQCNTMLLFISALNTNGPLHTYAVTSTYCFINYGIICFHLYGNINFIMMNIIFYKYV